MSEIQQLIANLGASDDYGENTLIINLLINVAQNDKKGFKTEDKKVLRAFLIAELAKLTPVLPEQPNYRLKDEIMSYGDRILGLLSLVTDETEISDGEVEVIRAFVAAVAKENAVESAVGDMFEHELILREDAMLALNAVKTVTDEYQRGGFFNALLHFKDKTDRFADDAKEEISKYISFELERYLALPELNEDEKNCLELAVDVCKFFITPRILEQLENALRLSDNGVRFFALETLVKNGGNAPEYAINAVANDLRYGYMLFEMLAENGKTELFPVELATDEYLAKSDLVQWLCYPTELDGVPYEIEYLGKGKSGKEAYHIFKYKSDSDNLSDDLKNEWLIGWSSPDGGTFSEFDKLSDYECATTEKTVKRIIKELIG